MNSNRLMRAWSIVMLSAALSQAGEPATTFSGAASKGGFRDGPSSSALYQSPQGLAVAASNSLLVADCGNSRIRCIQGNITTTFSGSGTYGRNDSQSRDTATFENPQCILPLSDGSVLVGDRSRVRIIRPNGVVATWMDLMKTTPGSLAHITSMALGTNGIVYVCDRINKRIYTRTSDGMNSVLCTTEREPRSLAIHPNGQLLVGEYERILAVSSDGAISVFHQANKGREEPLSDLIVAMAFDKRGRLFIADGYTGLLMIREGHRAVRVPSPEGEVLGLAISPDDAFAYVTKGNSILKIPLPR